MKTCKRCGKIKDALSFSPDKRNKDGLQSQCKDCYKGDKSKHYHANKEVYLEVQKKRKRDRKLKAIEYKGNKCYDCGNSFHQSVYEFHHLDPSTKEANPASLKSASWEKFKEELDKCVMLCANCHRMRHWSQNEDK